MATKKKPTGNEYDSVYFLKILLYLILGNIWGTGSGGGRILPLGIIIGVLIAQHEKLRLDRKIEYAMLLVGGVLGLVGIGITIRL
jgi:hypothetical protein